VLIPPHRIPLLAQLFKTNPCPQGLQRSGQFDTLRTEIQWNGYLVELDKTSFSFGVGYEIEIETCTPEDAKLKM